jgi:hypothetical protein
VLFPGYVRNAEQLVAGPDTYDTYGFRVPAVFYADGDEDLSLMRLVGHPRPTNPGPVLTKVAVRSGWPIMRFRSRGSGGPLGVARRLAGVQALVLAADQVEQLERRLARVVPVDQE